MATNSTDLDELKKNVDNVFIMTNAIIVCLMQSGFACLEAGAVRSKNTTNIIMKNIMDIFISCISYWLVGYALAYGEGNSILGYTYWAGIGLPANKMSHWFFQFIFAATAATIVSGAVAERCNFIAYIVYSIGISGIVYPPISRWVWTEVGWLNRLGYVDFSGCGPVHLLGGVCSFFGALFLGPRLGRFESQDGNSEKEEIVGHSVPLVGLGTMILITGFLSFNGGSLGSMTNPGDGDIIARVITNTVLGGTGGAITILIASKMGFCGPPVWNFSLTVNAALIGMVSVCAGVNNMAMWASFVCGVTAGPIYVLIRSIMIRCRVDDPLDAVAVHFGGGLWGLIAASLFDNNGLVFGAVSESSLILWHRIIGAAAIIVWGGFASCVMFGTLKYLGKLRVSEEDERRGLDLAMHNEPGYHPSGWKTFPPVAPWQTSLLSTTDVTHRGRKHQKNNAHNLRSTNFVNEAFVDTENGDRAVEETSKM
ncbi:putative ammonium transporter 1 isoform X1 [Zootermopsis nevadensis]|uniref:putative ammonium transporter 1 isoform X1 n=2 Tax=Zootermopsis nevadensis TaxID=136037 RepID=UPI000B8E7E1E|nr:putative ammonium transporter 1 isoform X1 [Zootermopsis nevadensis]